MGRRKTWQPGDLALHKNNRLDAREVAEVSADGKRIRIRIGLIITDWLDADNYENLGVPAWA